jgi:hypothetical protein
MQIAEEYGKLSFFLRVLQVRIISSLTVSLILFSFSFAAGHAGKLENDSTAAAPNHLSYAEASSYSAILSDLRPGQNNPSRLGMDLVQPASLACLPHGQDGAVILVSLIRPADRIASTDQIDNFASRRDNPVSFASSLADESGLGKGRLFFIRPISSEKKSLPEPSTMLLLGLGLIGLAACGGRKKFKRQ